ncbi:hypothetical protein EYF80_041070 [Liparis tanakae]|uniref:Uncharacterized protein n=1 Tax=Liparis tanakae TaxID=230148 RepID=A0A4Z2G7X7_9TELE|nr:hypothetical protein EYF80_041070 [Liparis tanakae]
MAEPVDRRLSDYCPSAQIRRPSDVQVIDSPPTRTLHIILFGGLAGKQISLWDNGSKSGSSGDHE